MKSQFFSTLLCVGFLASIATASNASAASPCGAELSKIRYPGNDGRWPADKANAICGNGKSRSPALCLSDVLRTRKLKWGSSLDKPISVCRKATRDGKLMGTCFRAAAVVHGIDKGADLCLRTLRLVNYKREGGRDAGYQNSLSSRDRQRVTQAIAGLQAKAVKINRVQHYQAQTDRVEEQSKREQAARDAKRKAEEAARQQAKTRITVSEATYGGNCRAKKNNVVRHLAGACNGKQKMCQYKIDHRKIGDPAPGCRKTFEAVWHCGTSRKAFTVSSEASGQTLLLGCGSPGGAVLLKGR